MIKDVVLCTECVYSHLTVSGECKYCDKWENEFDCGTELYLSKGFYCAFGERKEPESEDEDAQNKVETREVEKYSVHIDSNDGYIAKIIWAYDLEDAKRQVIKYFSQDKGKTVVIRPKHSKKAVKIVIK